MRIENLVQCLTHAHTVRGLENTQKNAFFFEVLRRMNSSSIRAEKGPDLPRPILQSILSLESQEGQRLLFALICC